MATAWAHLPNAALIDAVIAAAEARPKVWSAARIAARDAARDAAQTAAWNAAWDAVQGMGRAATWDAARNAAWDVVLGLLAWDDCAHLLDLPSTTLRTMADLCDAPACHQAMLLLPYVLVKEGMQ